MGHKESKSPRGHLTRSLEILEEPEDRPDDVPQAATHKLEDVLDHVLVRIAGNGMFLRAVRSVAWANEDDIEWKCQLSVGREVEGPLPTDGIGILHPLPEPLIAVLSQQGRVIARGDLTPFVKIEDPLVSARPAESSSLI